MTTGDLFLRTGVLAALAGMGLGIAMGASGDHSLRSVHAHINLVGWASLFLAGLYYKAVPAADGRLARWHYAVAVPGFLLLIAGITGIHLGRPAFEALAIAGSFGVLTGMILFAWIVFRTHDAPVREAVQPEPATPSTMEAGQGGRIARRYAEAVVRSAAL